MQITYIQWYIKAESSNEESDHKNIPHQKQVFIIQEVKYQIPKTSRIKLLKIQEIQLTQLHKQQIEILGVELTDTLKYVIKEVITEVQVNQSKQKQQQQKHKEDPQTNYQVEIFCQNADKNDSLLKPSTYDIIKQDTAHLENLQ